MTALGQPTVSRPRWLNPFFDTWSKIYDNERVQAIVYRPTHDTVIDVLAAANVATVVDVACGTGQLADRIQRSLGARVTATDWSAGMLAKARPKNTAVTWVYADAADLPLPDASADAVVCTAAFHWFPDQTAVLRGFARLVRPGGLVIIAVPSPPNQLSSRLWAVGSRLVGDVADWPTVADLRAQFRDADLPIREQRLIPRPIPRMLISETITIGVRP